MAANRDVDNQGQSDPGLSRAFRDACVRESLKLGLLGKRLILEAAAQSGEASADSPCFESPCVEMPVKTFLLLSQEREEDAPLPIGQDDVHGWVRAAAEALVRRSVTASMDGTDVVFPWFSACRSLRSAGLVEVQMSPMAIPFLRWAKGSPEYLAFLRQARHGLENPYAQRFYSILRVEVSSERPRAHVRMAVGDFRRIFLLTDKYLGNFGPLKQSVIKPALQEINVKQDIRVGYSSLNGPHNRTEAIELHVELKSAIQNPFDD